MNVSFRFGAVLLAMLSCAAARGEPKASREEAVFLFDNRKVTVQVPSGLGYNASKDGSGLMHVRIADQKDTLSLDVLFLPDAENRYSSARARKEQMFELFEDYVGDSKEKAMQCEGLM